MDREGKFWIWFWGLVIGGIVAIVLGCYHYHAVIVTTYVENGYHQVMLNGKNLHKWQKINGSVSQN